MTDEQKQQLQQMLMLKNLLKKGDNKILPVEPEPFESFKERFHKAIEVPVIPSDIESGKRPIPGLDRTHVWDQENGTRIVVTLDNIKFAGPELHFSISSQNSTSKDELKEDMLLLIARITGKYPEAEDITHENHSAFGTFHIMLKREFYTV